MLMLSHHEIIQSGYRLGWNTGIMILLRSGLDTNSAMTSKICRQVLGSGMSWVVLPYCSTMLTPRLEISLTICTEFHWELVDRVVSI